jgi:hypothetical protein
VPGGTGGDGHWLRDETFAATSAIWSPQDRFRDHIADLAGNDPEK